MKYLVLTLRKPHFDDSVIPAHYAFLQSLRDRGILEQAGPFTDRSGGAYVSRPTASKTRAKSPNRTRCTSTTALK
jgi:uncharacterized protein YciI